VLVTFCADYDRGCDCKPIERTEYGGFGWVDVEGTPAIVLDAEVTTLFVKESDGGYIVRNSVGEEASELPTAVDDSKWHTFAHATIELEDGRLFMFDFAARESHAAPRRLGLIHAQIDAAAKRSRLTSASVVADYSRGLDDDELSHCQEVIVIPTSDAQPSMNVSQAAAVMLYLCAREPSPERATDGATLGTMSALEEKLQAAMLQCGFLNPQSPQHVLRELSRALVRGHLTQREAQIWLSAFEHIRRVTASGAR